MTESVLLLRSCCLLQYALGITAALALIYAALWLLTPVVNKVLLVDFACFTPPQRYAQSFCQCTLRLFDRHAFQKV